MDSVLLVATEQVLAKHDPSNFDATVDAFPECIEYVRQVEDTGEWKARYSSLEEFYEAHQTRHPDIRLYGEARREIETADPLTDVGGTPSQRLAHLRG